MSRGVYVRGVSVQEGICPGVSDRGIHVRGGYVLEPSATNDVRDYLQCRGKRLESVRAHRA